MAEFGLTPSGYNRQRLADIKLNIEASLKLAFGEDIDLEPESGFGQFVGIMSEALADQNESQELVYNSEYPSTASGAALSNVVQFNGINRQAETKSTGTVTLSGTQGTVISAGSEVSVVTTGALFVTDSEVTIPVSGSITVGVTAEDFGLVPASSGSLTVIETPIFGWTSVTNSADITVGREEETDAELRARRVLSTLTLGQNLVDSLFGQLLDLDGVEDAVVISNGTDATVDSIPAHQFLTVVSGGDVAEIALAIWKNTPQGILSYGALTEVVVDDQGFSQDVKYSRPVDKDIWLKMDITTDSTLFPGSGSDDIKDAIVAYGEDNFMISDDVILSGFYTAINETPGVLTIDLRIGFASNPTGTSNLVIDPEEISRYAVARVEVNLV